MVSVTKRKKTFEEEKPKPKSNKKFFTSKGEVSEEQFKFEAGKSGGSTSQQQELQERQKRLIDIKRTIGLEGGTLTPEMVQKFEAGQEVITGQQTSSAQDLQKQKDALAEKEALKQDSATGERPELINKFLPDGQAEKPSPSELKQAAALAAIPVASIVAPQILGGMGLLGTEGTLAGKSVAAKGLLDNLQTGAIAYLVGGGEFFSGNEKTINDAQQGITSQQQIIEDTIADLREARIDYAQALDRINREEIQLIQNEKIARAAAKGTIGGALFQRTIDLETDIRETRDRLSTVREMAEITARQRLADEVAGRTPFQKPVL